MARRLQIPTAAVFVPLLEPARYKGAHGGRGCLHPDALIDTPDGQVKISEFSGGDVYSWHNGRIVIAKSTKPSEFTVEDLFEVTLADGRMIVATDEHKFLTDRGWITLSDLSMSDEVVVSRQQVLPSLLLTSQGIFPSVLPASVPRLTEIREGYLGDCSLYLRQYGQQLRSLVAIDQWLFPPQGDERQHSFRALSRLGGLALSHMRSLSSSLSRHSTRYAPKASAVQCCEAMGSHSGGRTFGLPSASYLPPQLSRGNNIHSVPCHVSCGQSTYRLEPLRSQAQSLQMLGGMFRRVFRGDPSCSPSGVGDFTVSKVRLIRKHSRRAYWDLHVFGTNNYLSNGIVNHNSGKSHFFGGLAVEDALRWPGETGEGLRFVGIREVQKTLKDSAKFLIEKKLSDWGLGESDGFKVFRDVITTPKDGIMIFNGMNDHTADSVKSLEGFHRAFVEEAQSLSNRSMTLLRPTIRAPNSELWFGWNPERPTDAVDMMLRGDMTPTGSRVVMANYSDNPWLPDVLRQEMQDCLDHTPEKFPHIWGGEYATVLDGAYFAKHLNEAQLEGRISFFAREQLSPVYAFWDIGGTSRKSDATTMWIVQLIGDEVRVLNYYEAVGQPFEAHVNWLRSNGYGDAKCILPHDGATHDTVFDITPEGFLGKAGFQVDSVPNQGKGAALNRIEAARLMFPHCRFNEDTTQGGRDALGWYHEKKDEVRGIGLGPEHDWASHGSDAFGLIAVYRDMNKAIASWGNGPIRRNLKGIY